VSHSSKDREAALELATRLREDGLKVWLDEWEIGAGDLIPLKIEEGLAQSRTLVLLLSANAFASDWVTLERHTALFRDPTNTQRHFIPVRVDEIEINEMLRQFSYVDWRHRSPGEYSKLLRACSQAPAAVTKEQVAGQQQRIQQGISQQ
jgi:hypothetical protein